MAKIAIVTDSSAGISKPLEAMNNIHVLRMPIIVDDKEFIDEINITPKALIQMMKDGGKASTSQAVLGYIIDTFNELLSTYDEIIYLPISRKLSGAYTTGKLLENDSFKGKLTVVDTLSVAYPLYNLTCQARKMADQGWSSSMIKETIEKDYHFFAILIPEDIAYLKRGGRITPAAAALANLLKIIPILKVTDGEIDKFATVRTHKKAFKRSMDFLKAVENKENYDWFILDSQCEPRVLEDNIRNMKEFAPDKQVIIDHLSPIVMCHTGPGSLAFGYTKKLI